MSLIALIDDAAIRAVFIIRYDVGGKIKHIEAALGSACTKKRLAYNYMCLFEM